MEMTPLNKRIIAGISIGSALIIAYVIYKAIGDYQTGKRIANMDANLAKLSGGTTWDSKILDKITFKDTTDKIGKTINDKL